MASALRAPCGNQRRFRGGVGLGSDLRRHRCWGLCARPLAALVPHPQTCGLATVMAPFTDEETALPLPGGRWGAGTHPNQGGSRAPALTAHAGRRDSTFRAVDRSPRAGVGPLSAPSQVLSRCLVLPSAPGCWTVVQWPCWLQQVVMHMSPSYNDCCHYLSGSVGSFTSPLLFPTFCPLCHPFPRPCA